MTSYSLFNIILTDLAKVDLFLVVIVVALISFWLCSVLGSGEFYLQILIKYYFKNY